MFPKCLTIAMVSLTALVLIFLQSGWAVSLSSADIQSAMSWLFSVVLIFMAVSTFLVHKTLVTPYFFYLMAVTLFLGGRFIAHLAGFPYSVFALANNQSVSVSEMATPQAVSVMLTMLPILLAIHAGYMLVLGVMSNSASRSAKLETPLWTRSLIWPACGLMLVAFPLALWGGVGQLLAAQTHGYTATYASTAEYGTRLSSLGQYGVLLAIGLAFASGNRLVQTTSVLALGILSAIAFLIGIRSNAIAFTILAIWFVHLRWWRIPSWVAILLPLVCVGLAQGSQAFSARTEMSANQGTASSLSKRIEFFSASLKPAGLLWFANAQGSTMLYIPLANQASPYPWPAFVQTFVPGFGAAAAIAGKPFALDELYFGQHMAKTHIPEGYARGEGLGWSIVMDIMVFAGEDQIARVALSMILGGAFAALVSAAGTGAFWLGALAMLIPKIVLLPRSGLFSIFPYLFTYSIMAMSWFVFLQYILPKLISLRQPARTASRKP